MRDIKLLHPELQVLCRKLIDLAAQKNIEIAITQTYRTKVEQETLYALWRNDGGNFDARYEYPYSLHCWGLAFDFAVKTEDKLNWNLKTLYQRVGELGQSIGLQWGGSSPDGDINHMQMPGYTVERLVLEYGEPAQFIATFNKFDATFKDMVDHPARKDVEWLEANDIINPSEYFRPDEPITRAEAATMIRRSLEYLVRLLESN